MRPTVGFEKKVIRRSLPGTAGRVLLRLELWLNELDNRMYQKREEKKNLEKSFQPVLVQGEGNTGELINDLRRPVREKRDGAAPGVNVRQLRHEITGRFSVCRKKCNGLCFTMKLDCERSTDRAFLAGEAWVAPKRPVQGGKVLKKNPSRERRKKGKDSENIREKHPRGEGADREEDAKCAGL